MTAGTIYGIKVTWDDDPGVYYFGKTASRFIWNECEQYDNVLECRVLYVSPDLPRIRKDVPFFLVVRKLVGLVVGIAEREVEGVVPLLEFVDIVSLASAMLLHNDRPAHHVDARHLQQRVAKPPGPMHKVLFLMHILDNLGLPGTPSCSNAFRGRICTPAIPRASRSPL